MMKSAIFKTFVLSLSIVANVHWAYADTQSLIPNGKATFLDSNGKPLSGGTVKFYIPNTTTPKTTYQDIDGTIPNTNPVVLDAAGRALIWGTGNYRQQVKDKNGNIIWDVTTSAAGSGGGGGAPAATGDGDAVGTIKPWAGMIAPNQYMFTYGQEISRTTYPFAFATITSTQSVFCTNGSPVLSGVGDTNSFWIGMKLEVSCIPTGITTVISKTANSITMAVNANATLNTSAVFFPWGNGNGSTTFNLPDYRGIVPVGNNIMGGVASTNLTSQYFGNDPNSIGAKGGNQSAQLGLTNLPANIASSNVSQLITVNSVVSDIVRSQFGTTSSSSSGGALGQFASSSGNQIANIQSQGNNSISVSSNNTGSGGQAVPFGIVPPSRTTNYIIKVTPDAVSPVNIGVTSVGGMFGDLACGAGLTCSGNVIAVNTLSSVVQSIQGMTGVINCGAGLTCSAQTISQTPLGPLANATVGSGLSLVANVLSASGAPAPTVISTSAYGAVCNGVADDSNALLLWRNAINSATTQNVVAQVQPGNCMLNSATVPTGLVFTRSYITIDGGGNSQITVFNATAMTAIFGTNDQSFITYKGLRLVGNNLATSTGFGDGQAIAFTASANNIQGLTVEDNYFTNFQGNYWIYTETVSPFNKSIQNVRVNKNYFISQPGNCLGTVNIGINCSFVVLFGVGNIGGTPTPNAFLRTAQVTNNFMYADYMKVCIQVFDNVQDVLIDGNQCYNAGQSGGTTDDHGSYALMVYENESPSTTIYGKHVIITNNYIFNARDNCLYMANEWTNSIVHGNTCEFQTSTATITLPKGGLSFNGSKGTTVTSNRMMNIAGDGITLICPPNAVLPYIIANNTVQASLNGAIKIQNSTGTDCPNISVLNNSLLPQNTAYGVSVEDFINLNPGSTFTNLRIEGNSISAGVYGIRLFPDPNAPNNSSIFNYTSISRNNLITPATVGIDISQMSGGSITLDGNIVNGAPTTASYILSNNKVLIAQNNICTNQNVGYCYTSSGAEGTLRNNSFRGVPLANVVQTLGATDLGRVAPTFGYNAGGVVQNLIASEVGTTPNKYVLREWYYDVGGAGWLEQRMTTGH